MSQICDNCPLRVKASFVMHWAISPVIYHPINISAIVEVILHFVSHVLANIIGFNWKALMLISPNLVEQHMWQSSSIGLNYLTYSLSLESIYINYVYIWVSKCCALYSEPNHIINTDKIISRHQHHVSFDPLPPAGLHLEAVLCIISTHYWQ